VDRQAVYDGAAAVGRPLSERVAFVIESPKPIARELGL
jgi:hypothetical protein